MYAKKKGSVEELAVIGIDIGKETFHLVGFDRTGQLVKLLLIIVGGGN